MKKFKSFILFLCLLMFGILSIVLSDSVSEEIKLGITRCLNIIIPSLFCFLVFSNLLLSSKYKSVIIKPFYPLYRYIFNMDGELFLVFLLGNICGYPVGMKLIDDMYERKQITNTTAKIMSCYCYGAGPSFTIGMIGISMYHSANIGLLLLLSNILSNMVIALVLNRFHKPIYIEKKYENEDNTNIVSATTDASRSLFLICSMIIMFSSLIGILKGVAQNFDLSMILPFLEISNITNLSTTSLDILLIISTITSFGGVCIIFQIKAIAKSISLKFLALSRLPAMLLSIFFTIVLQKIIPIQNAIFTSSQQVKITSNSSILPSVLLIIMLIILIFTKEKRAYKK